MSWTFRQRSRPSARCRPRAAIARETARLRRDEIDGSLAIAGIDADPRRSRRACSTAGSPRAATASTHYIAARDLAAAAAWVAEQRPIARRRSAPADDGRRRAAAACARDGRSAGASARACGGWRSSRPARGIVSPPPWSIAKETTALVDRFRRRPGARRRAGCGSPRFSPASPAFARSRGANGRAGAPRAARCCCAGSTSCRSRSPRERAPALPCGLASPPKPASRNALQRADRRGACCKVAGV